MTTQKFWNIVKTTERKKLFDRVMAKPEMKGYTFAKMVTELIKILDQNPMMLITEKIPDTAFDEITDRLDEIALLIKDKKAVDLNTFFPDSKKEKEEE